MPEFIIKNINIAIFCRKMVQLRKGVTVLVCEHEIWNAVILWNYFVRIYNWKFIVLLLCWNRQSCHDFFFYSVGIVKMDIFCPQNGYNSKTYSFEVLWQKNLVLARQETYNTNGRLYYFMKFVFCTWMDINFLWIKISEFSVLIYCF